MSAAMQNENRTGDKEWVALFPKHATEKYLGSLTFIKQLTVVAISGITYVKKACPEDSFSNETLAGQRLKMLKVKCEDKTAQFVSTALKQTFEAFDKKYVQQLAMCFYNGDYVAENLIEYHIFEYSYTSDGVTFSINSKNRNSNQKAIRCSLESVKTNAAMLIRSIMLFVHKNCGGELPVDYGLSLNIYYTRDCPENYQAPGFEAVIGPDDLDALRSEEVCHGSVETPYHKLIARTYVRGSDAAAAPDFNGQPEITQAKHEDVQAESPRPPASASASAPAPRSPVLGSASALRSPASASGSAPRVRCPCHAQDAQGDALLVCQYCHTRQHALCFGVLAPGARAAHCCEACAARDPSRTPTCSWLAGLSAHLHASLCVFRRTMVLCLQKVAMSGAQLQAQVNLSPTNTVKMLQLLAEYSIMPDCDYTDLETPRIINHVHLRQAVNKFFGARKAPACKLAGPMCGCGRPNKTPARDAALQESPLDW